MAIRPKQVNLFVTCIIDQLYPQVGESVVRVLRKAGAEVGFPRGQTCCGQPLFNAGFTDEARTLAQRVLQQFPPDQPVVVPSGSCASMLRVFYPQLFRHDLQRYQQALSLSERTYELCQYLVNQLGLTDVGATFPGRVTYHPSCHLLRELGVVQEPMALIKGIQGVQVAELAQAETCCGFGGSFSVKYPHISEAMLKDKVENVLASGAQVLVGSDMGCLMHIDGALSRRSSQVRTMHIAQLLDQGQGPLI